MTLTICPGATRTDMDYPFLVRITCSKLFGTGVLVAPNRVLTCAHVATPPGASYSSAYEPLAGRRDITVYFPATAEWPESSCQATVVDDSHEELALLALDRPVARAPLRIYRLAADLLQSPDNEQVRRIAGFTSADETTPMTVTFEGLLLSAEKDDLIEFQTKGGLWPGMSGSPLLASMGPLQVCLGMAFHGGRYVSHSRFIGPAPLLAFLRAAGIDGELREAARLPARATGVVRAADDALREAGAADPLVLLRPLQSAAASCLLIPVFAFRGLEPKAEVRPVFRSGVSVRIHAHVPNPCNVTFINVERVEGIDRTYTVIGLDVLPGELPAAGAHRLPTKEPLVLMHGKGTCSLVMLAWTPRSGWQGLDQTAHTRVVAARALQEPLASFQRLPAAERYVSVFDYDVR
jgi:hypothetical protein